MQNFLMVLVIQSGHFRQKYYAQVLYRTIREVAIWERDLYTGSGSRLFVKVLCLSDFDHFLIERPHPCQSQD